jgi:hypothetical protein
MVPAGRRRRKIKYVATAGDTFRRQWQVIEITLPCSDTGRLQTCCTGSAAHHPGDRVTRCLQAPRHPQTDRTAASD